MATATQSVSLSDLLDSIQTVLVSGNGVSPGTGINESYVQEVYDAYHPRSGEPYEATFALFPESPEQYSGAGRWGHNTYLVLEVVIYTRLELDPAGSDYRWSRDSTYGALRMRALVQDVLQDNFLYDSYDSITHLPNGNAITVEGLQQIESPRPQKPDTDSTSEGLDVGGYGNHRLYFSIKTVMPLKIN